MRKSESPKEIFIKLKELRYNMDYSIDKPHIYNS
jgi:hypothetical protein